MIQNLTLPTLLRASSLPNYFGCWLSSTCFHRNASILDAASLQKGNYFGNEKRIAETKTNAFPSSISHLQSISLRQLYIIVQGDGVRGG